MNKKVLVIEDTKSILTGILDILTYEGFEAIGAENGWKGVEMAEQVKPDLILCDIMMPDIDGYEVIRKIRMIPGFKNVPFIFLTALATKDDQRIGMDLGADDYVSKPFTADQLISAIKTRLSKKESEIEEIEKEVISLQENISRSIPSELLSPLNNIIGIAKLMNVRSNSLTSQNISDFSNSIHRSAEILLRTIKKIIYFTEIELIFTDTEKKKRVTGIVTTISQSIIVNKINELGKIHNRLSGIEMKIEDISVRMDENHFIILINELIDNAFKFSSRDDAIKIDLFKTDKINFTVYNQGIGIAPENLKRIMAFRQFKRDTYEEKGLGLGLLLVKRLVELYQGEFTINSRQGADTEVTVRLNPA